jgi:hypothetical protein
MVTFSTFFSFLFINVFKGQFEVTVKSGIKTWKPYHYQPGECAREQDQGDAENV